MNALESIDGAARKPLRVAALLIVASAAVYAGSPCSGFVADDHQGVLDNPLVTTPGRLLDAFATPFHGQGSDFRVYRPLTTVSFAVQWAAFGPAPWAFHLVNVLLHVLATLLVWVLARGLLGDADQGGPQAGRRPPARLGLGAAAAGLLFAVHPVHTDAVSAVIGRSELLVACLCTGSFLAWRSWSRGAGPVTLFAAALLYLLGILSKESAGPLPVFAAAWSLWSWRRPRAAGCRPVTTLALGALAAFVLPLALYAALRGAAIGGLVVAGRSGYFDSVDGWTAFLTMAGVGARYLALMLLPFPLSPDYSFESIPLARSASEPWPVAGLVLVPLVAAAAVALLVRRRGGGGGLGLAWFLAFMLPATNVVPLMIPMAERIAYAASAGACVAFGAAVSTLRGRAAAAGQTAAAR